MDRSGADGYGLVIRTDSKRPRVERLVEIFDRVSNVIFEEEPDVVAVESYAFGMQNSKSVTVQAEVGGIIRALAGSGGAAVVEVAVSQWKSAIMGKQNVRARKRTKAEQAMYLGAAKAATGVRFTSCDEADACMIGLYVRRVLSGEAPETDAQRKLKTELMGAGYA